MRTKILSILIAVFLLAGMLTLSLTVSAASKSDTTPPTLSVKLNGDKLTVSAKDSDSGLQAIFIDSTRVNSLVNGKATVNLKDYAGKDKKISVYAMDYVGNKSEVKKIDNPYYAEPTTAKATEALQQTTTAPKSTSQSGGGNQILLSQAGAAKALPAARQPRRRLTAPRVFCRARRQARYRVFQRERSPRTVRAPCSIPRPARKMISSFIPLPPTRAMCFI